jgi:hypothetical protein
VPSYPDKPYRSPADLSATLASLFRFDRAHPTDLAELPARRWRDLVSKHAMDSRLQLPWSEVTGKARGARDPRGCALSWQTRFVREFDADLATAWWRAYKASYFVDSGIFAGFREWPKGRDRAPDIDSGPIVKGVGSAASTLGIAAARALGDAGIAARLESAMALAETWAASDPAFSRHASSLIAVAIIYLGKELS